VTTSKSETQVLTYSRLMAFMQCPRLEYYKYRVANVGLKTTAPYIPYIEGELGHYALKFFYKNGTMLRENMLKRVAKIIDAAGPLDPETDDDLRTAISAMVGAVLAYKEQYYGDIDHTDNQGKVIQKGKYDRLMVEEPFEFEFEGYKFDGRIDLLARDRTNKKVVLIEHKFTSGQLAGRLVQLPMDLQEMIYCEAVKQLTGAYPDFKIWNFIRKSQLRRKKMGDILEPVGTFEARVQKQYIDEPDKMFFRSQPLVVEPKMIENVRLQLANILKDFRAEGKPVMRFSSCLGQYGRPCEFIQACTGHLLDHADGWNAPESQGLYRLKEAQHEELRNEDDDKAKKPAAKK